MTRSWLVARPRCLRGLAAASSLVVGARQQALRHLGQDVSNVQRLGHGETEPAAQQLRHLVFHPGVEGETPFVGGDRDEEGR